VRSTGETNAGQTAPEGDRPVRGLTDGEVRQRRAQGLVNRLSTTSSRPVADILRTNFLTLFNAILVVAVGLLLAMGQLRDAVLTGGLVLFTVAVSTSQELVAKVRLDRLTLLARAPVRVIRDGAEREIDPGEVVQGDYLALARGEQVVADGHLVRADRLETDESLLTGEAEPAQKRPGDSVLSGSFCVAGSGVYVAERVGQESYAQNLTAEGRRYRNHRTPLQQMLDRVLRVLLVVVIGLSLLELVGLVLQGAAPLDAVRATAVMVTLVPQGLLLMSTVAYSLGALRVARQGALAQQLNAVESLSHVDTLCFDKTGTLTRGQLALREVVPVEAESGATGRAAALVGRYAASVTDPTGTIGALARALPAPPCPVADAVAFSSERKWSALTFADGCEPGPFVLGAPEMLLPHVDRIDGLPEAVAWREAAGERVLLFAAAPTGRALAAEDGAPHLPNGLRALALLALEEELRPDAPATLAAFAAQGVTLKLISGDDPRTALALARRAGLPPGAEAISGAELPEVPAERFAAVVERATVFGRVTPQQKRAIIRALKAQGRYVAMVGDGVNDVLALQEANLGIAMRSGSASARAVADVVLINDSFAALPAVLRAGRQIVNGLRLALRLFLVRDVATIELVVASNFVGAPFPLLPPHAALLAFLTVGLPAFFVVAWASAERRAPNLRADAAFVLWVGNAYALAVLTIYVLALAHFEVDVAQARTAVVTTGLVSGLLVLLLLDHPLDAPVRDYFADRRMLALVGVLLAAYLGVLYLPGPQRYFELAPLHPLDWLAILPSVVFWFGALRLQARYHVAQRLLG
jgi:cation-transporting P-type ATPase E